MQKIRADLYVLSREMGGKSSVLTGVTRAIVTPEKRIPENKNKYLIPRYVSTKKGSNSKSG